MTEGKKENYADEEKNFTAKFSKLIIKAASSLSLEVAVVLLFCNPS